jgi:hypothetical protein
MSTKSFPGQSPIARSYYMLFTREGDGYWHPQFGDYLRATVMREERDTYASSYAAADRRIRRLPDDQHASVVLAQWILNHNLLRGADGYQMQSRDILAAFGLPPNSPIPASFSARQRIGDVAVTIVPRATKELDGKRLPKRRVVAQCPLCGDYVCAGHLDQHMKAAKHRAIVMDPALMSAAPITRATDLLLRGLSEDGWLQDILATFPNGWDKAGGPTD